MCTVMAYNKYDIMGYFFDCQSCFASLNDVTLY